jgi:acyl-CoA dehydrogenase
LSTDLFPAPVFEDIELQTLRREVRDFIAVQIRAGAFTPAVNSWMTSWDTDFTHKLAERNWLGMTIPIEYGGHGKSFLARFVVTEELVAAGAPVAAHWFADRQVAPSILRYGSPHQKQEILPRIAAGSLVFAIGMSEPDAGSDLASIRTKGTKVAGGWRITGSKVWMSNAHRADKAVVLARTSTLDPKDRHSGLSQFIVDLQSDGVEIRPILSLNGEHHFNEVYFDSVLASDAMVLGEIGSGWSQVTSELGFERSGPERFLSTQPILEEIVTATRARRLEQDPQLGRYFARFLALHYMSMSVAGALARNEAADLAAGVVKHLGTLTEGDITEYAAMLIDDPSEGPGELRLAIECSLLARAGFTLRGGTNEILRGMIARGLGLR